MTSPYAGCTVRHMPRRSKLRRSRNAPPSTPSPETAASHGLEFPDGVKYEHIKAIILSAPLDQPTAALVAPVGLGPFRLFGRTYEAILGRIDREEARVRRLHLLVGERAVLERLGEIRHFVYRAII